MIKLFKSRNTELLFHGEKVAKFMNIAPVAIRKLQQVHAAGDLRFLRVPPNNRLEALKGDRKGQHSIRINDQWRICFEWKNGHCWNVEIVDYH